MAFALPAFPSSCLNRAMPLDPIQGFLMVIAAIFLVGIAGELVFERTGVPDVLWLILVGVLIGPITSLVRRADLLAVAPYFGAITLVVVLFSGGTSLRLADLGRAAPRATLLAVSGFLLSLLVVCPLSLIAAWLGLLPPEWSVLHGLLLGAILGGSSSVVVMPSLQKAKLEPAISNLMNVESALTDILCVVVAGALMQVMQAGAVDARAAALQLGRSFGLGLGLGVAAGLMALPVLRRLSVSAYGYPLTLAALMLLYVGTDLLGGSAALAILSMAVIVGNAPALSQGMGMARPLSLGAGVSGVHQQVTFIVKSFFFTLIGALLAPPVGQLLLGVVLGAVLLLARLPAAALCTLRTPNAKQVRALVAVSLPRGMAAGVLSMLPAQAGIPGTRELPVIVFAATTTTIVTFAVGFPVLKKRLLAVQGAAAATTGALPDAGEAAQTAQETPAQDTPPDDGGATQQR
jgi:Na+:H+ antiporter